MKKQVRELSGETLSQWKDYMDDISIFKYSKAIGTKGFVYFVFPDPVILAHSICRDYHQEYQNKQ